MNKYIGLLWCGLAGLVTACTRPNPAATCPDGTCSDPDFWFCDVDGVVAGTPGTCVSLSCSPAQPVLCRGSDLLICNATGNGLEPSHCAHECVPDGIPHCDRLLPKYLPDVCTKAPPDEELNITEGINRIKVEDTNCNGGVSPMLVTGLCIMHYTRITIAVDTTLAFEGLVGGGLGVALVADGDIVIDGTVDVAAHGSAMGPGGRDSNTPPPSPTGHGGGGNKTPGGPGATLTVSSGAANGGPPASDPASQMDLLGGWSGGGYGLDANAQSQYGGGGGGGAATLISCSGTITVSGTGVVNASGGGGAGGGTVNGFTFRNAFGGGSGGNVVFQAMNVIIDGFVFSNGGGGGAGRAADGATSGRPGQDGPMSIDTPASGGVPLFTEGAGGHGGIGSMSPGGGFAPTDATSGAGAGGGSVGFLQIYVPAGVTPTIAPSHTSPELTFFTRPTQR